MTNGEENGKRKSSGLLWALLIGGGVAGLAFLLKKKKPTQVTHKECSGFRCVNVVGAGADQCQQDGDCLFEFPDPREINHTECQNGQCVNVFGFGEDECSVARQDCPRHKRCVQGNCQWVDGIGEDSRRCKCVTLGEPCIPICINGQERRLFYVDCQDNFRVINQTCVAGFWEPEFEGGCNGDFDCGFKFCPDGGVIQRLCGENCCCSDPECPEFNFQPF